MEDKKKKYVIPEAELFVFNNEDVIATSNMAKGTDGAWDDQDGDEWK